MKKHLIQFVCQSNKYPRPELARELLPWTYGTTGLGSLHHRFSIRHEAGASFQKCKQNFEFQFSSFSSKNKTDLRSFQQCLMQINLQSTFLK